MNRPLFTDSIGDSSTSSTVNRVYTLSPLETTLFPTMRTREPLRVYLKVPKSLAQSFIVFSLENKKGSRRSL
ncbi:unknown [Salmonella phage FelixO1]|uniref:Uncharacterized protein n=1 Tax=Salmonella phage Felix O1 (isolate Felix O1-VT1) TaxID=1283336 RepID=Q6KGN4_BPFO1|nr:unknown [Salmonella phage FelixO1]